MKLYILWGQRKENYPDEYAPEALNCWTEFEVEENEDGFVADCKEQQEKKKGQFEAFRVIPIEVSGNKIRDLLIGTPEPLKGEIVE